MADLNLTIDETFGTISNNIEALSQSIDSLKDEIGDNHHYNLSLENEETFYKGQFTSISTAIAALQTDANRLKDVDTELESNKRKTIIKEQDFNGSNQQIFYIKVPKFVGQVGLYVKNQSAIMYDIMSAVISSASLSNGITSDNEKTTKNLSITNITYIYSKHKSVNKDSLQEIFVDAEGNLYFKCQAYLIENGIVEVYWTTNTNTFQAPEILYSLNSIVKSDSYITTNNFAHCANICLTQGGFIDTSATVVGNFDEVHSKSAEIDNLIVTNTIKSGNATKKFDKTYSALKLYWSVKPVFESLIYYGHTNDQTQIYSNGDVSIIFPYMTNSAEFISAPEGSFEIIDIQLNSEDKEIKEISESNEYSQYSSDINKLKALPSELKSFLHNKYIKLENSVLTYNENTDEFSTVIHNDIDSDVCYISKNPVYFYEEETAPLSIEDRNSSVGNKNDVLTSHGKRGFEWKKQNYDIIISDIDDFNEFINRTFDNDKILKVKFEYASECVISNINIKNVDIDMCDKSNLSIKTPNIENVIIRNINAIDSTLDIKATKIADSYFINCDIISLSNVEISNCFIKNCVIRTLCSIDSCSIYSTQFTVDVDKIINSVISNDRLTANFVDSSDITLFTQGNFSKCANSTIRYLASSNYNFNIGNASSGNNIYINNFEYSDEIGATIKNNSIALSDNSLTQELLSNNFYFNNALFAKESLYNKTKTQSLNNLLFPKYTFYFNDTNEYPTEFVHKPDSEPVIYTSNNNLYTIYGKKLNSNISENIVMYNQDFYYMTFNSTNNTVTCYKFDFVTQKFNSVYSQPVKYSDTAGSYPPSDIFYSDSACTNEVSLYDSDGVQIYSFDDLLQLTEPVYTDEDLTNKLTTVYQKQTKTSISYTVQTIPNIKESSHQNSNLLKAIQQTKTETSWTKITTYTFNDNLISTDSWTSTTSETHSDSAPTYQTTAYATDQNSPKTITTDNLYNKKLYFYDSNNLILNNSITPSAIINDYYISNNILYKNNAQIDSNVTDLYLGTDNNVYYIKDNKTYDSNNTVIQNTNKYFGQTLTNTFSKKVYFDKNSISDNPDFSNSIKLQNLEFDNFCNFYMGNTKTEILPVKKNIVFDLSLV